MNYFNGLNRSFSVLKTNITRSLAILPWFVMPCFFFRILMPKFFNVVENDLQYDEKETTDLSKDFEELTPTKHIYSCKSAMRVLTSNESESVT